MAEIFQYLVVFLLAVWTARLAITKGRNGWTWGCAALVLGLLPWHLIGVLPVLALMFIKTPIDTTTQAPPLACIRCNKSHIEDQHFCTGCGWDLRQADTAEKISEGHTSSDRPSIPSGIHSTEVVEAFETQDEVTSNPLPVLEQEAITERDEASELDSETRLEDLKEEHVPWGTYDVGEAPTAPIMVLRGIERLNEGKFQEAIDQFTKAIALDPNYAEAWEKRSEAYTQLGRLQRAEADRRHLQGLDPSSSPS